jgi:hypothetical protein
MVVLGSMRKASSIVKHSAGIGSSEAPIYASPMTIGAGVPSSGSAAQLSEGSDPVVAQALACPRVRFKPGKI